ncbi:CPBP family intramembrane glutamic endopeptidase [Propionibacteriaceae bacterium G1746]|uniref:CPBP family intramembrane glutamic endopeptidase n=1 Tax=Aestuariimicrobium sp. G57 TaxID=3418485 RepID=UPI003C1C2A00
MTQDHPAPASRQLAAHDPVLPFGGPTQPISAPDSGVPYTQVLRGRGFWPVRSWFGLAFALFGYALIVPLVNQGLVWLFWLFQGRPGSYTEYFGRARGYEMPLGLVAGHVALAMLIPISLAMVALWHRRPGSFLGSVQPGMRWRYLLLALPVAALILNVVLWVDAGSVPQFSVPDGWWWWVLAIVVFSPLQAAGEEFFFRGYLLQGIGSLSRHKWVGIVASAFVFAMFHGVQNVWLFVDRFAFGLLAALLVVLTGGLEAAIAAHVANNVFAFGYAVFSGSVASTRAVQSIGPKEALVDVLGFALVALATWWLGRRLKVATTTP